MSEENVAIALALVDAWNRGDRDAFISLWDEEAEFYPLRAQLEGEAYRGHEGLDRFITGLTDEWAEVRFEIDETHAAGDRVVGIGRFQARGRTSGVDIDVPLGVVTRVRDGKVIYTRLFSDPAEALQATGVAPPTDPEDIHTPDGVDLHVRSIQPDDRQLLAAFVDKLSPASLYRRFLGPKQSLAEGELTWFTDLDHHDREALIALDGPELVAVARYIRLADRPAVAEVAVTVADAWQLHGVGTVLLTDLAERAHAEGVTAFAASCLADNLPMIALLRAVGPLRQTGSGAGVLEFEVELPDPANRPEHSD